MNNDFILLIPARISSERLPRKPLIEIYGEPMVVKTYNNAAKVVDKNNIYIVTDSHEIESVTKRYNIQTLITSKNCLTGSDRVAEAAKYFDNVNIYNLQGDEPFFPPNDITNFIESTIDNDKNYIGVTKITNIESIKSRSIPKVVLSKNKKILYTSRAPIPASKSTHIHNTLRQVCIYKYNKNDLIENYGPKERKSNLEKIEDLEILRLIENDIDVYTIMLSDKSISIDTPEDLLNLPDNHLI